MQAFSFQITLVLSNLLIRLVGGGYFITVKFATISHPLPVESMRLILNS